jgi:BA14K-like protein
MIRITIAATGILTILLAISLSVPTHAQNGAVLRYGNTSPWSFDGRDDDRDFRSNGSFPGNFATDSSTAWIGAAGLLGSNPQRSVEPYPSQVVFGSSSHPASCVRYRSYDAVSRSYVGRDGRRHRC